MVDRLNGCALWLKAEGFGKFYEKEKAKKFLFSLLYKVSTTQLINQSTIW
jgi:hypothetical protein